MNDRQCALPMSMGTLATLSKYQNVVILNCKDARELCTSLASSGHQATNSLSSGKKAALPSAQQSRHAPTCQDRGEGPPSRLTPEMDEEEQPAVGNLAQIWILQGLAPEDMTFMVVVVSRAVAVGTVGNRGAPGGTGL